MANGRTAGRLLRIFIKKAPLCSLRSLLLFIYVSAHTGIRQTRGGRVRGGISLRSLLHFSAENAYKRKAIHTRYGNCCVFHTKATLLRANFCSQFKLFYSLYALAVTLISTPWTYTVSVE
jgi:hypothetical protein